MPASAPWARAPASSTDLGRAVGGSAGRRGARLRLSRRSEKLKLPQPEHRRVPTGAVLVHQPLYILESGCIPAAVRVRRGFSLEPSPVSGSTRGFDGVVSAYHLETRMAVEGA